MPAAASVLHEMRQAIRGRHYSRRTEKAYLGWARRFLSAQTEADPGQMSGSDITRFLSNLAVRDKVSASTQNQAFSAILFLFRDVLKREVTGLDESLRARRPTRLPQVLSPEEVARLLRGLRGAPWLMASLMYGAGLRLLECARLRVKDLDFDRNEITVHDGKGRKDRVTVFPARLAKPLRVHLVRIRAQHARDVASGGGSVALPHALSRKYPHAAWEWAWQWVFPATRCSCGSGDRQHPPASPSRDRDATGLQGGAAERRDSEGGDVPYLAALVRDPSPGRVATTSGRSRSFWAIRTWRRP